MRKPLGASPTPIMLYVAMGLAAWLSTRVTGKTVLACTAVMLGFNFMFARLHLVLEKVVRVWGRPTSCPSLGRRPSRSCLAISARGRAAYLPINTLDMFTTRVRGFHLAVMVWGLSGERLSGLPGCCCWRLSEVQSTTWKTSGPQPHRYVSRDQRDGDAWVAAHTVKWACLLPALLVVFVAIIAGIVRLRQSNQGA